jgi:hypothetical protein
VIIGRRKSADPTDTGISRRPEATPVRLELIPDDYYEPMSAHQLSELTHREEPWRKARRRASASEGARCDEPIREADMAEYYDGLTAASSS